jgi:two-component system LytT family response regulator
MQTITCIIVDDEPLARELLSTYVQRTAGWQLQASCSNAIEAYDAIRQYQPAVIFLDIKMPVITGIDFLLSLDIKPIVIFTTAYPQYAAHAFDLHATDYLLKPITEERFQESIQKASIALSHAKPSTSTTHDYIFLKHDYKLVKVKFEDILFIEAMKDFSKIHLKETTLFVNYHLKLLEDQLPKPRFLRIHRSYIIAIGAITALQGNTVELGKVVLPIGNAFKNTLLTQLKLNT